MIESSWFCQSWSCNSNKELRSWTINLWTRCPRVLRRSYYLGICVERNITTRGQCTWNSSKEWWLIWIINIYFVALIFSHSGLAKKWRSLASDLFTTPDSGRSTQIMLSLYLLRCLTPLLFFDLATATEKQCHYDCRQVSSRLVGPTRPYHDVDALGNPLRLTRPYPYRKASTTEGYDFPRFCELGCTYFYVSSGAGMHPSWPSDKSTLNRCMEQCDDTYRYNVTVAQ